MFPFACEKLFSGNVDVSEWVNDSSHFDLLSLILNLYLGACFM